VFVSRFLFICQIHLRMRGVISFLNWIVISIRKDLDIQKVQVEGAGHMEGLREGQG